MPSARISSHSDLTRSMASSADVPSVKNGWMLTPTTSQAEMRSEKPDMDDLVRNSVLRCTVPTLTLEGTWDLTLSMSAVMALGTLSASARFSLPMKM